MDQYARRLQEEEDRLQKPSTLQDSLVLRHAPLLAFILSELPTAELASAALVSRTWNATATDLLLGSTIRLEARALEAFTRLLQEHPAVCRRLRAFELNNLPSLAPNLTSLTIASSTRLQAPAIADFILSFPELRDLIIVGQDGRSRRRRLLEVEPEGEIGKALRAIADASLAPEDERLRPKSRLRSLSVLNTPLKLSSLDYFLEVFGSELTEIALESCSLGPKALVLVEQWCPRLRQLRLDTLLPTRAPPMTPRPNLPPLEFDNSLPLSLSHCLTALHLASLPALDPSAFSSFSQVEHASLQSLSLSHCTMITAIHLSHFTRIRRLRIVACPNVRSVPVFPDRRRRDDVGTGCKELRQLSVLGSGLRLGNLWELAMLSREEISEAEHQERRRLGLGGRGLVKLTVDGAIARDREFSVSGFSFTLPSGLGCPPALDDLESHLPRHLLPPTRVRPHLETDLLDSGLPSYALFEVLLACEELEELSLFGQVGGDPFPLYHPIDLSPFERARGMLIAGLDYLPLVGNWLAESRSRAAGGYSPPVGGGRKEEGHLWRGSAGGRDAVMEGGASRLSGVELDRLRADGSGRLCTVHA